MTRPTPATLLLGLALAGFARPATGDPLRIDDGAHRPAVATEVTPWLRLDLPIAHAGHVAVLDTTNDRVLVLGDRTDELWSLSLRPPETWTRIAIEGDLPGSRDNQPVVHDPVRNRWLLFRLGSGDWSSAIEVWELDLAGSVRWRRLFHGVGPGYRNFSSVAYDPAENRVLVYGGTWHSPDRWEPNVGEPRVYRTDLWEFDLDAGAWTELPLAGPRPVIAQGGATIFDAGRRRVLVIGLDAAEGVYGVTRVWALPLDEPLAWRIIVPYVEHEPLPVGFAASFDPTLERIYVHGGLAHGYTDSPPVPSGRTSLVDLVAGTARNLVIPAAPYPPARWGLPPIFDPRDRRHLFIGGWRGHGFASPSRETWSLSIDPVEWWVGTWRRVGPWEGAPMTREGGIAAYDPRAQRLLAWGGDSGWPCMNYFCTFALYQDLWGFDLGARAGGDWTALPAVPQPPAGFGRTMATGSVDVARNRLLVFGGAGGYVSRDVYGDLESIQLDPAGAWTRVPVPGVMPPPRYGHGAVVDSKRQRLLVFDGVSRYVHPPPLISDAWSLDLAGAGGWSALPLAPGSPTPGLDLQAIHDAEGDRVLAVAPPPAGGGGAVYSAWAMDLATAAPAWTSILVAQDSGPRVTSRAAFDPVRRRLLLFENLEATASGPGAIGVWALDETASPARWTAVATGPSPPLPGLATHPVVYDALHDRFVIAGVGDESQVWALTFGAPTWPVRLSWVTPGDVRAARAGGGPRIVLHAASPASSSIHPRAIDLSTFDPRDLRWTGVQPLLAADGSPRVEAADVDGDGATDWIAHVRRDPSAGRDDPVHVTATNQAGATIRGDLESMVVTLRPDGGDVTSPRAEPARLRILALAPVAGTPRIRLECRPAGRVELAVFDVRGRQVARRTFEATGEEDGVEIALPELRLAASGVYLVRARRGERKDVARIVKF